MIIFKRKHLSIKWGIFAGLLVFLAILLLLLFLLQTVYLDDIYKAAKKNTLNNANDKVEQILDDQLGNLSVMEQQLDELTAEYDIDIQISGEDGTLLYSSLRMYENTLPKQFYQGFYKRAKENGGGFTKVGRESQETFCNYRTMMSNFVEMLYRQLLVLCLCPCVLYDILFISVKNIYSYSQLKEGTYAYGTATVKNISIRTP